MFKYRFTCSNKDTVLYKMQQRMCYDAPCNKTIFGFDLYSSVVFILGKPTRLREDFILRKRKIIITGATQYAFVFSENL